MNPAVKLVSISQGAEFDIDLSAFPGAEPVFAYVDDLGSEVLPMFGLDIAGRMTIEDQPEYMWLNGPRNCVLLKTNAEGRRDRRVRLCSLGAGEFCLEIYHIRPDQSIELLYREDFCFK